MFFLVNKKWIFVLIIYVKHTMPSVSHLFCHKPEQVALRCSKFDTSPYELKLFEQKWPKKIIHPSYMNKIVWTLFRWPLRPSMNKTIWTVYRWPLGPSSVWNTIWTWEICNIVLGKSLKDWFSCFYLITQLQ